jgi:hypothetical protein
MSGDPEVKEDPFLRMTTELALVPGAVSTFGQATPGRETQSR